MATTLLADKLATWQKVRHGCKNMRSESDLESLLESQGQQSVHWAAVTAARTAIRAIPFGVLAAYDDHKVIDDLLPVFRFCIMSWAASNIPTYDFSHRAYLASGDMLTDRLRGNSAFFATAKSAIEAIEAAYYRREWEKEHEFGHTVIHSATECLNYARSASSSIISKYQLPQYKSGMNDEALDAAESRVSKALFDAIGADVSWLSKHSDRPKAARRLTARKLWLTEPPELWIDIWKESKRRLLENEHSENYAVWIDWYERRIRGERAAFDIPGDKGRVEDKKILRRLAEASDEDFWGKGHEYVNATLKGWLDEARARVAPPIVVVPASGVALGSSVAIGVTFKAELETFPLPQNRNVLSFGSTPEGRISIDASALADQMRNDQGAQDRYAEAVCEAKAVLDRCQRSNAGARLTRLLENYLAAAGEVLNDANPSLIVQRGERLRQELAGYDKPDSLLAPLADDLLLDLKGWLTAHNMMVGLDPVLNAADLAMLGPDRQPALIPPSEIREKVQQADDADILDEGVAEIVLESADLAPTIPDATDRRTLWSVEVARNLIWESIGIALNPSNAEAQAAAMISVSGIRAFCGSITHAKYIIENREWILSRLGSTPTLRDLITRLADRLEEVTPYGSK
jgi:hypothetical protein